MQSRYFSSGDKYQKRFRDFNKSKFEIAEQLALLSEPTPIREEIGCELDGEATEQLQQFSVRRHSSSPTSLLPLSPTSTVSNSSLVLYNFKHRSPSK